jgi:hypothetical protein
MTAFWILWSWIWFLRRKKSGNNQGEDDYELYVKAGTWLWLPVCAKYPHNLIWAAEYSVKGRLPVVRHRLGWSPLFCDVDNDGWKDLFITNGIYRRANDLDYIRFLTANNFFSSEENKDAPDKVLYDKMPLYPNVNYIYKNNGDLTFSNKADDWGFNTRSYSNGSCYADLDNDGDLDLIVNNINEQAYIYRNNASNQLNSHFLSVVLKGKGLNSHGIGARVTIFYNSQKQIYEQFPTRGFMSASSDVLHFGLGLAKVVDSVLVRWPDLSEQTVKDVPSDKFIALEVENAETFKTNCK